MKRVIPLFLLLMAFSSLKAQVVNNCNVVFSDTLAYVDSKTTSYLAISMNQINDGGSFGYAGYGQRYGAPDSVLVSGFCFKGFVYSGVATTVGYKMYKANGSGLPGATLVTGNVTIPLVAGFTGPFSSSLIDVCVDFAVPQYVEGDYIIALQNLTSADLYLVRNSDGNGAAEDLALTYYKGVSNPTYDGWYKTYSFGAGWNFDVMINPVIEHSLAVTTTYNDALCLGDTTFLEVQSVYQDSVYGSKYYNPNYASFSGLDQILMFNYGDGSSLVADTNHYYLSGGQFSVEQYYEMTNFTWSSGSVLSPCQLDVVVTDATVDLGQDRSMCMGDSVVLTTAIDFDQYSWNNGVVNDTLIVLSDTMVFGTYQYSLEGTIGACVGRDTVLVTLGELIVDLGSDTTLCLNQNVILNPGLYDSYDWNTGQTTSSITVGPFAAAQTQNIIVEVTSGNCVGSDTLMVTVDNCLGVDEATDLLVSIFPNPANDLISIRSAQEEVDIILFDISGEMIANFSGIRYRDIDVSSLENGVYLLQIRTSIGLMNKKIQIIH